MYEAKARAAIDSSGICAGASEFDASVLFEQAHVDPVRLRAGVDRALRDRPRIGLAELVDEQPLEQGLAELVTYLALTSADFDVVFDESRRERLSWVDQGHPRTVTLPCVTYSRSRAGA